MTAGKPGAVLKNDFKAIILDGVLLGQCDKPAAALRRFDDRLGLGIRF